MPHRTSGARPVQQIAIAVVKRDGTVLIRQRGPEQVLPGYWEFPGGKVRPGETPADAALRECREETGLMVSVNGLLNAVQHSYEHATLALSFFRCQPISVDQVHADWKWVRLTELDRYEFPPANGETLRILTDQRAVRH